MAYGLRVKTSTGQIIIDGSSRMLRLHAAGSLYFSFGEKGNQQITENFTPLGADPMIIGYFDPFISSGGWSLTTTLSNFTIKATSLSSYSGYFYYNVFRQK